MKKAPKISPEGARKKGKKKGKGNFAKAFQKMPVETMLGKRSKKGSGKQSGLFTAKG